MTQQRWPRGTPVAPGGHGPGGGRYRGVSGSAYGDDDHDVWVSTVSDRMDRMEVLKRTPPWISGRAEWKQHHRDQWVAKAAETLNELGYQAVDAPNGGLLPRPQGAAGSYHYRFSPETLGEIYDQHAYRYYPHDYMIDAIGILEDGSPVGLTELRNARGDWRVSMQAYGEGPDTKEILGHALAAHPDYATSGDFSIRTPTGEWAMLEEMYVDPEDPDTLELHAGDQVWQIDTSDDVLIRRNWEPKYRSPILGKR